MIEPDGAIWVDDSSRGNNWGSPEWTTCHSISEQDQKTIRALATKRAAANPCLGSQLGEISWPKADSHYVCADESYGPADPYAGVEDFFAMCDACFGSRPELQERADGDYYGAGGVRVLERRRGPVPH
jgi:hypothetical protein